MSEQLEQTILGAALNSDSSAQLVTAKLSPQDFYFPRNEMRSEEHTSELQSH